MIQLCGKTFDDDFRLYILENGLNLKTNISFTNFKRTYDDGINRYLKKEHFYRVLTNGETIKRNWMLYSETTGMAYCSVCKLFANRETHFTSGFNHWKILIGCMNMKTASHTGLLVYPLLSRLRMHE